MHYWLPPIQKGPFPTRGKDRKKEKKNTAS